MNLCASVCDCIIIIIINKKKYYYQVYISSLVFLTATTFSSFNTGLNGEENGLVSIGLS